MYCENQLWDSITWKTFTALLFVLFSLDYVKARLIFRIIRNRLPYRRRAIFPPAWLLVGAWTLLTTLMSDAMVRVHINDGWTGNIYATLAFSFFILSMVFSAIWIQMLLRFQLFKTAYLCLAISLVLALVCDVFLAMREAVSSVLYFSYILWLCYLLYLNGIIMTELKCWKRIPYSIFKLKKVYHDQEDKYLHQDAM